MKKWLPLRRATPTRVVTGKQVLIPLVVASIAIGFVSQITITEAKSKKHQPVVTEVKFKGCQVDEKETTKDANGAVKLVSCSCLNPRIEKVLDAKNNTVKLFYYCGQKI